MKREIPLHFFISVIAIHWSLVSTRIPVIYLVNVIIIVHLYTNAPLLDLDFCRIWCSILYISDIIYLYQSINLLIGEDK